MASECWRGKMARGCACSLGMVRLDRAFPAYQGSTDALAVAGYRTFPHFVALRPPLHADLERLTLRDLIFLDRFAQMCAENAETAPSEGDRMALLGLARLWLQLASDAESPQPATPDPLAPVGR